MSNPFDTNQPNQISSILEATTKKPRIVQCIQAHNEEGLIRECMLQVYDKVDKILVLEGAVQNRPNSTDDGHSTDRTVEIIKDVIANEDPDDKFEFIQIQRFWTDLEDMKNAFFQYMKDGDWMLITDVDEFIMPEVIDDLRRAIDIEPHATEFVPAGFFHFWRDAYHIRRPSGDWGQQHQRFIKFQEGLYYRTHPIATDKDGNCTYFQCLNPQEAQMAGVKVPQPYYGRRFVLPSFYIYHYSYCKLGIEEEVRRKKEFYDKELAQDKHGQVGAYARGGQTEEFLNRTEPEEEVLSFDRPHPPILQGHLMLTVAEDIEYEHFSTAEPYCLDEIPLVWIWAQEKRPLYDKLFNTVEV